MNDIVELIAADYKINENDCYVLNYIIAHLDDVSSLSLREIAKNAYCQPMVISRLAKKLEFQNFKDFIFNISRFIETYYINDTNIKENDSLLSNISKTTELEISIIKETKNLFVIKELETIISLLDQSKYIDIFANEANSDLAKFYEHYFSSLGKIINIYDETDRQIYHTENVTPDHLIIIISKLCENPYLKDSLVKLHKKNIKTILITSKHHNSMSKLSTYTLTAIYDSSSKLSNYIFHTSVKYILDTLYIALVSLEYKDKDRIEKTFSHSYISIHNK